MAYYSTTDFNNENYEYSIDDSSSVSTNHKMQKKVQEEMKRQDPGYFTIRRNVKSKRVKLELYKTPISYNLRIRNAITGIYENAKVGTHAAGLHFKVSLCTGEAGKDPAHLYFDSPEQYEVHFGVTLDNSLKAEWQNNYMIELDNQRANKNRKFDVHIR